MHRNAPETVAQLTGGEYFRFGNTRNLESSLLTISNHVPNRYVLSFQPRAPHPGLHSIKVRLKEHPNFVVTARRSYWADNEPTGVTEPIASPLNTMDFDQLEIFLEVARLSSFSRAAEKRFRTQPAISSQIRALEEEVGARLLDRSGGRVSLTASGKLFFKYAEETIERRKTILTEIAETERVPRGEIVVGANEGTCLHILPEVFAQFKRDYPKVAVSIKRSDYARILESILENVVDFGVVSLPVTDNRLEAQMIHRDELVVITAPSHALAAKKSVTVAEVSAYPLVLPKLGHTRDALDALFYDHHLKPNLAMELDSSELLKRFVAADVGVGFIARSNIEEDIRANALVAITLADAQIRRDLALVFRKDKSLSRAAKAFMDIAVKQKNFPAAGAGKRSK